MSQIPGRWRYHLAVGADGELLRAWAGGDERAGYTLYKRHASAVVRFLRNKVDERDVDDLLQSTFMRCIENAARFQDTASFRGYLLGFARNLLLHHYRRRYRKDDKVDFGVTSVQDLGVSPSSVMARKQQEQLLLTALRSLPIEHQILLELFYWENLQGPELSQMYEVPEGTIRTRLRRARQLLVSALEALGSGPAAETEIGLETWAQGVRAQLDESPAKPPRSG